MQASIDRATTQLRERARLRGPPGVQMGADSNVAITSFTVSPSVESGGEATGSFRVVNNHFTAAVWDDDFCWAGLENGLRYHTRVYANDRLVLDENDCIQVRGGSKTHNFAFGNVTRDIRVRVVVTYATSGDAAQTAERTVEVTTPPTGDTGGGNGGSGDGGTPTGPGYTTCPDGFHYDAGAGKCVPDDADGDGGGAWLPCFVDPFRSCTQGETMQYGILGAALLIALTQS